jgi:hypothetical protein
VPQGPPFLLEVATWVNRARVIFYLPGVHVELRVEFADWRAIVCQGFPGYMATSDPLGDGAEVLTGKRSVFSKKPKSDFSQRHYLILGEF